MAGAWGYEKDHYDVSIACGERVLFPSVRKAGGDTLVVTDGFSCKTQIEQGTGIQALHVAEVLRIANGERSASPQPSRKRRAARAGALAAGALAVAGGALALREH
jgi:hypothetical protein